MNTWVDTPQGRGLVKQISRTVVSNVAPEELDLFDELIGDYFRNPQPPAQTKAPNDDPLGFGLGEVMVAVSPAAGAMVTAALQYILAEAAGAVKEESAEAVKVKIRGIFQRGEKEEAASRPAGKAAKNVTPLTKEQLEQVKKLARKQAIQFGVPPGEAEKMALALIGALAVV